MFFYQADNAKTWSILEISLSHPNCQIWVPLLHPVASDIQLRDEFSADRQINSLFAKSTGLMNKCNKDSLKERISKIQTLILHLHLRPPTIIYLLRRASSVYPPFIFFLGFDFPDGLILVNDTNLPPVVEDLRVNFTIGELIPQLAQLVARREGDISL